MSSLVSLRVEGIDAAKFLQGYLTSDVESMQPQLGAPTALTDIKGRVIANGWCYGTPACVTIVFHNSLVETVKNHLGRYMVFAKSEFADEIFELGLSATVVNGEVELAPFGWGVESVAQYENQTSQLTVEHEFPIVEQSTSGLFLPQMLNLTQHGSVSFTKGCYLGQEIVARAEHRGQVKRQLFRITLPYQKVSIGSTLELADRGSCTVVGVHQDQILVVGRSPKTN